MGARIKKPVKKSVSNASEERGTKSSSTSPANRSPAATTPAAAMHPALARAITRIQKSDYHGAAELLRSAGRDTSVRNTLGVCLLRLGQVDEALSVFRQFVLLPGNVTERPDISNACKRNFATALLLKGSPSGALTVIQETREANHPMAVRIGQSIQRWEKSLSWLRRLDWKLNRIEPPHCQVPIDFEPGEFEFDVVQRQPDGAAGNAFELAV